MRLIDADKLIDFIDPGHLRQPDKMCFSEIDIVNMINSTPTAYDVDEVLRQLDREKKLSYADLDTCAELGPLQEPEERDYFVIGLKKAIKIVKCESESLSRGNMNNLISREQLINKLNSTGINIKFDLPVEEILGENVDLDDFAVLMQDAIQAYRKMVIDTIKNMSVVRDNDNTLTTKDCLDALTEFQKLAADKNILHKEGDSHGPNIK